MITAPAPLCLYVEDQPREAVACLPADEQDVLHERRHAYLILAMQDALMEDR